MKNALTLARIRVGNLNIHVKSDKVRDQVCTECGKAFSIRSNVKNHDNAVHKKIKVVSNVHTEQQQKTSWRIILELFMTTSGTLNAICATILLHTSAILIRM